MTDVSTTPRKPLTRQQRLKLFEAHKGVCWRCKRQIVAGEKWRDEHIRPLALGGTNNIENRAPVHEACAREKDKEDLPRIAQAKRQKMMALGIKDERRQRIKSRGFPKVEKRPRIVKQQLPPRRLYIDAEKE